MVKLDFIVQTQLFERPQNAERAGLLKVVAVKNGENEEKNTLEISQLFVKSEQEIQFWSVADEQRFSLAFLAVELLSLVLEY